MNPAPGTAPSTGLSDTDRSSPIENHLAPIPRPRPRPAAQRRALEHAGPLLRALRAARRRTDALFEQVPAALFHERPIAERHRLIFYVGHLDAFDANLLLPDESAGDPSSFARRFAFGIDPMDGQLPDDRAEDWPTVAELRASVKLTRGRIGHFLAQGPASVRGVAVTTLLHAAIEHRLMHAETLAYLLNRLPIPKPVRAIAARDGDVRDAEMVAIPAGAATLGAAVDDSAFAWDNELPAHTVEVDAFRIDRHMVTNAQFLRFLEAGGYREPRWWNDSDWDWISTNDIGHPAQWRPSADGWRHISFLHLVPFQSDWPVYVSHAEASAYARWHGKRLPTEAEWHRAAYADPHGGERRYPWGNTAPTRRRGNFAFARWEPMRVDAHPAGRSAFGVEGLLGNGWEWTSTPFAPFPGFQPFGFYPGYSADFFDGRHFVLKGGSPHTAARLLRRSFRNWFQPHYPYPFAGFRCVSAP